MQRAEDGRLARLDPLGQCHFAVPRQEVGRRDLLEIAAQGVGGAAELDLGQVAARRKRSRLRRGLPGLRRLVVLAARLSLGRLVQRRLPVKHLGASKIGPHTC